jgi:hypothetical protein
LLELRELVRLAALIDDPNVMIHAALSSRAFQRGERVVEPIPRQDDDVDAS